MLRTKITISSTLILSLICIELQAQEIIPTTGGNASGSGGSASYTVGQVVYTTNNGANGSVAQGIQQPYEISVVSGVDETESINLILSVYPNPTTDILTLKIESSATQSIQAMSYQLYDISGKLLENKKIDGSETSIGMSKLEPSIYFLKVTDNNKSVKTFKIIKN